MGKLGWFCGMILLPIMAKAMPTGVAGQEIQYLLDKVARSECRFERSGSWYDAASAVKHLQLKLSKAGDRVKTADDFIRGVASKSYFSDKPYHLACPAMPVMESGAWLDKALQEYRRSR